jgi:hypothetical protein
VELSGSSDVKGDDANVVARRVPTLWGLQPKPRSRQLDGTVNFVRGSSMAAARHGGAEALDGGGGAEEVKKKMSGVTRLSRAAEGA